MSPVAAVYPMTGGVAPTKDPIQVFKMFLLFIGVYMNEYNTRFNPPKTAVITFTYDVKMVNPRIPVTVAKVNACNDVICPVTSGLLLVRDI